ncbi:hypothetical protein SAMN05444487_103173 [Marininema mesophilum]|uniref:Polyketide cyclase / dehydrase and lipid transport n=1 Tax=Marininema mesophilum TaxID=1048340 RepID=A0A1H2TLM1_9BACL|nr:hypothetical protein [Marininema mesophilum]SDW44708.1 hypothetical protein SAMN05444487_103173 [Marininema mesophilum]
MPITKEMKIKTTKEQLFNHLESVEQMKKWFGALEKIEIESPTNEEEICKGSLLSIGFRTRKVSKILHGEVVAYRKPELFGIRLHLPHVVVDLFFDLSLRKGVVLLQCDCEIGVPEGSSKLRAYLSSLQVRYLLYTRLKRLKSLAEKRRFRRK